MKISLIVVSIAALCIQSTLAQATPPDTVPPPGFEIEDISNPIAPMVSDMIQDGWPEDQAQVIVSLFDAVDALADLPERNEEDSDEARFFDNLRVDVSQVLAEAGYAYKSIGSRRRAISRLADGQDKPPPTTTPPTAQPNRKEALAHMMHQIVSLLNSASMFIGLLDNPTLSEYIGILLNAAKSIEKLVNFPGNPI